MESFFSELNNGPNELNWRFISPRAKPHETHLLCTWVIRLCLGNLEIKNWCLHLQFNLEAYESMTIFSSLWTKVLYYHTLQTIHLPLGLPSHLSSLLPFLTKKKKKKPAGTSHKKVFWMKTSTVGMESSKTNQTRWEWHHNTSPSLYLVPFCQLCTSLYKLSTYTWPIHTHQMNTVLSTAHFTVFHIEDSPYLPCSATIKLHTQHYPPHCLPQPSFAHNKHKAWSAK